MRRAIRVLALLAALLWWPWLIDVCLPVVLHGAHGDKRHFVFLCVVVHPPSLPPLFVIDQNSRNSLPNQEFSS